MNALRQDTDYTTEDIYALPDGKRAELIDGQIYYMASPNTNHQRLVMNFTYSIEGYIRNKKGSCQEAPDWVIEIVSPGIRSMDYYKKLIKYRTAGVREYWVTDPEKKW